MEAPCEVGQLWRVDSAEYRHSGESLWAVILEKKPNRVKIYWLFHKVWQEPVSVFGWDEYLGKVDYIDEPPDTWPWFDRAVKIV